MKNPVPRRFVMFGLLFVASTFLVFAGKQQDTGDGPELISRGNDIVVRFAVARSSPMGGDTGYLYVSTDRISYVVIQPPGSEHGFDLPRSELTVARRWHLMGIPGLAAELKFRNGSTWHFFQIERGKVEKGFRKSGRPLPFQDMIDAATNFERFVARSEGSKQATASARQAEPFPSTTVSIHPQPESPSLTAAQTPSHLAAVPPQAQAALDKGMDAVKQQHWDVAVKYFFQAQEAAPANPSILMKLALAHAKAGHELTSIAWLETYLAAASTADNTPEVRNQIEAERASARKKMEILFKIASDKAQKIGDESRRRRALEDIEFDRARLADVKMGQDPKSVPSEVADRARERYAAALISSEMYDDARNELLRISKHDICDLCPTDEAWQKLYKHFLDAEKFDAAEDAASHAANWERRGLLHEIQLRRRTGMMEESIDHKNYDANSIDTLVAFSKPGRERDKEVLRPIVFALLHAGDSRRARQYAHQVSEVGGRAELLLSIALSEIKDGDRTNAIVDAREVLRLRHDTPIADWPTYGGDGLVAVASAIVGDYAFAFKYPVGDASQFQYYVGDPSFIGFFEPYLEDYGVDDDVVFGRIAFIQAMAGKVGDALKTAKMADTRIKDPEHFPYAEIGYAQLLQGRLSNALDTAVRMPAADSARSRVMKSNLIGRIMYEQIKTGDLKGAEKTISLFIPPIEWKNLWHIGVRYQIDGYIALAEAYRIRKNMPEVSRYLAAAQKMILNARLDDRLQSQSHNPVFDLLGRVADAQAAAGDAEATQTLRALIPSPYLQSWLDMAVSLSTDKLATDLTSQLQAWTENATYSDSVIGAITQLALEIDTRLLKMRALEQGATNVK